MCGAIDTCGCVQRFESPQSCKHELAARVDAMVSAGAFVDRDCLDTLRTSPVLHCESPSNWQGSLCGIVDGNEGVGEPCSWHLETPPLGIDECASGLICSGGECREKPVSAPVVGESCDATDLFACEVGMFCDFERMCRERLPVAAPCEHPLACATGYCAGWSADAAGVCRDVIQPNEPCDPQDWQPCGGVVGRYAWCDPVTKRCATDPPAICLLMDHPKVWPSSQTTG